MATIVLGAVGTLIGGPVGGAIGALLGQGVDARLLSPRGRKGPRLDELRVQTSSYGAPIPRVYGRMRVGGTVIWSTDLVERSQRTSNGKGRGSSTNYSYSVSFAVALSSRPILGVRRIWAEGNLLRGSDGAFKSPAVFRLHHGGEDQAPDPFIAAAEGPGAAPAYRGIAYALFEGFDLTPFGGRVPSLTFEVEADAGAVPLLLPLADMLGGATALEPTPTLAGCALVAESRAGAVEPFAPVVPVARQPGGGWRTGIDRAAAPAVLGEPAGKWPAMRQMGDDGVPRQLVLSAYDPARDFQVGEVSARVAGGAGAAERLALPVAVEAGAAKALVAEMAARAGATRRQVEWPQGFAALGIGIHDSVRLPGESGAMLVVERRIDGDGVGLSLRALSAATGGVQPADGGRALVTPDLAAGASVAALFDLPAMLPGDASGPRLVLAAAGGPGWRGGLVRLRPTADAPAMELGVARPVGVLGTVEAVSPFVGSALIDRAGAMTVRLHDDAADLNDVSDADLIGGANLAMAGGEALQFGRAEPLGGGRWRLSTLLRGRFGTEDRGAVAGDAFAMLDDAALFAIPAGIGLATTVVGGVVSIEGSGDAVPVERTIERIGHAGRPLSPVHLRVAWSADGALGIAWTRRSRGGFAWADGVDAPIDAAREAYRVEWSAGAIGGTIETATASILFDAGAVAAMRAGAAAVLLRIVQVGDSAVSPPLTRVVTL